MNNYRVKIKMIITDFMDLEADSEEEAILKVTDLLNKCVDNKTNLLKVLTAKPNFLFSAEEIEKK